MIRRPPRSTLSSSSAASDVYKRQDIGCRKVVNSGIVWQEKNTVDRGYVRGYIDPRTSRGSFIDSVMFRLNENRSRFPYRPSVLNSAPGAAYLLLNVWEALMHNCKRFWQHLYPYRIVLAYTATQRNDLSTYGTRN